MDQNLPKYAFEPTHPELLFIGFDDPIRRELNATLTPVPTDYRMTFSDDPTAAVLDLRRRLRQPERSGSPLAAVLLELDLACAVDYRLLRTVSGLTRQTGVPVLLLARETPSRACLAKVRQSGAADVIPLPLHGSVLLQKVAFFRRNVRAKGAPTVVPPTRTELPWTKRAFDVVMAGGALMVLSPLLLVTAAAIYVEGRGKNVFYVSQRVGSDYRIFDFLKFRSMIPNADQRVQELQKQNRYGAQASPFFKMRNDPRVTRIGRFIRRYSIDELPQLWNVLRGEMSIVGNRPLPLREAQQLTKDQAVHRFLAPAGLTGLWQIAPEGKDNVTPERRIELDIEYANSYSLWTDLKIIARTLPALVQGGEKTDQPDAAATKRPSRRARVVRRLRIAFRSDTPAVSTKNTTRSTPGATQRNVA